MKTAISVPDDLFRKGEAAAKRLHVSRSQLYANALAEYLKRERSSALRTKLREVYSRVDSSLDTGLERAQFDSLDEDRW